MIFILLVYDYENSSSQTSSLSYQFWVLENVSRGMAGPTVRKRRALAPNCRWSKVVAHNIKMIPIWHDRLKAIVINLQGDAAYVLTFLRAFST